MVCISYIYCRPLQSLASAPCLILLITSFPSMAVKILCVSLMATSAIALIHTGGLYRRELDEETDLYLQEMCLPTVAEYAYNVDSTVDNLIPSLHDSPFPCEQQVYILNTCVANDTTSIDYLAEQQCICGSNFRETIQGCGACYSAHGLTSETENTNELVSSIWTAECSARPTQAFQEILYSIAYRIASTASTPQSETTTTLENDQFPSQTAVSNYWTGLPSPSLGSITGSATARATVYSGNDDDDFGDDFDDDDVYVTLRSTSTSRRANFSYTSPTSATLTASTSTQSSNLDTSSRLTTSAPTTSAAVTAISQTATTVSTSTNGVGMEMGLAWNSGVVLVVVNVAVVALL